MTRDALATVRPRLLYRCPSLARPLTPFPIPLFSRLRYRFRPWYIDLVNVLSRIVFIGGLLSGRLSEVCHFNEDSEPVVARLSSSASFTFDTFPRGSYPPIIVVVLIKKSRLKVYSLFRKDYVIFFILFLLFYEREEEEWGEDVKWRIYTHDW